ncbi:hypothetical protein [Asticcacaulis sp.]|uniref:hypothetical protein n=1 Tax=Asticcacaulis sp. TaxID=1872648 RepID=UPI002CA5E5AF|nr:hypothetical protein [Asticcacaulis sp.]HTM80737.1 hypothetical protein [Asticcacaulis sp.]
MVASRIVFALALAAGSLVASLAVADEVVVAASRPAPLPTAAEQAKAKADVQARAEQATRPLTTEEQVAAWTAHSPKISRGDQASDDGLWPAADASSKRQVHGEASVTVGTGGYRSAYVSSLIPLGENGTLGIAVSQTDYGNNARYGYGYGDPYGYGYDDNGYGYGRGWGRRGGSSQSVALSLDMTGKNRSGASTPEGCAPGFRNGDRYIEPVWVTRMNGNRDCETAIEP